MLENRTIVLGICGGIAVYKIAALVRLYKKAGADVHVVMTAAAREFVTPMTFQTLSCNKVHTDMFDLVQEADVDHISLADRADLFVVAPATANMVGKIAHGLADDLLSTSFMASKAPRIIVPSMNVNMYRNPVYQANEDRLRTLGYHVMKPVSGFLACGYDGEGKLPEPEDILAFTEAVATPKDLAGQTVLVTAGPTREEIDPVRFLSNYSSGKMGYAVADAAAKRGARVLLISGPTALSTPAGVEKIAVESATQMLDAVRSKIVEATVVVKAAAVADYRPSVRLDHKAKKGAVNLSSIELVPNVDILAEISKDKGTRIHVGFAAETEEIKTNAQKKLAQKNLDLIVANDVTQSGAGFDSETNQAVLFDATGASQPLPLQKKSVMAHQILDRVVALLPARG